MSRRKGRRLLVVHLLLSSILLNARAAGPSPWTWELLTYDGSAPALDWNPLRGFMPDGVDQAESTFPHSMVWINLPLRPIMTGPSSFDWTSVEQALNQVRSLGYQAVLHFYVDYPGYSTGIPQFLLDQGLRTFAYGDLENNGKSLCPDYRDQRIVQAFTAFLIALGARYDGDPRIASIVPGLYGFRGDWQVGQHSGWEMFPFDKDLLVSTMEQSFKKTMLQLRHPSDSADKDLVRKFGLYDAAFVELTLGSHAWNFWQQVQTSGMTDLWQTQPMTAGLSPLGFDRTGVFTDKATTEGKKVLECIRTTHLSWLVAPEIFDVKGMPSTVKKDDVIKADRLTGYQLSVSAVSVSRNAQNDLAIEVRLENHGIAPFYGKWPVEISTVDSEGHLGSRVIEHWPLATILPGSSHVFSARLANPGVIDGAHLLMRIVTPLPGMRPVRFANISQDATLDGWLTLANIRPKAHK